MANETMMLTDRLLTEEEAARILSCSTALLRKWRLIKDGPAYCKVGRLVRYPEADLRAFIERNRRAL
jgi:predicted DNA-binding transcriptional regulator AlpA